MNMRKIVYCILFGLIAWIAVPTCLGASTTKSAGSIAGEQKFASEVEKIKSFLFGSPLTLAAVFGLVYSIGRSIATQSPTPMMMFGVIIILATVGKAFISEDGLLSSLTGALTP